MQIMENYGILKKLVSQKYALLNNKIYLSTVVLANAGCHTVLKISITKIFEVVYTCYAIYNVIWHNSQTIF